VLQLLDHQIVDTEHAMVANVDDLELTLAQDGSLEVTGLLIGAPALVPRMSGGSGRALQRLWHDLGVEQAERDRPGWISLQHVRTISSEVVLDRERDGLVVPQPDRPGHVHYRLSQLCGMTVYTDGVRRGRVLDVRLEPVGQPVRDRLAITHLVIGRGRPGANLGYDRHPDQGPWVVSRVVRWLHRHSTSVEWTAVRWIDWAARRVEVAPA
jgi:sporulation protein YlmC with PRC-barrel domain